MEFIALSKKDALYFACGDPWAAISISTEPGEWPKLSTENRVGLLQLHFWDIEFKRSLQHGVVFDTTHAKQILEFAENMKGQVKYFMVHCEAGMSRSAAVAAALQKIHTGSDEYWFKNKTPNMMVYRTIFDTYHEGLEP